MKGEQERGRAGAARASAFGTSAPGRAHSARHSRKLSAFRYRPSGGIQPIVRGCAPMAGSGQNAGAISYDCFPGTASWQRSFALRAETEVVHCPPGTASLATLVRPPGGKRRCSLPTRDCVPGNVRAPSGRGNRSYSLSSRDFVPGNARPPSGRKEKVFIAHQGLRPWQRSCALRAGKQKLFIAHQGLRPWQRSSPSGRKHKMFTVRPPGRKQKLLVVHQGDCVPGNIRPPSGRN